MIKKTTNDNNEHRGTLYSGELKKYAVYIDTAQYLISKYIHKYWKNDKSNFYYIFEEWMICSQLYTINDLLRTQSCVTSLAKMLNANPLELYSDPNIPEFKIISDDMSRKALQEQLDRWQKQYEETGKVGCE
jgi:hypothetical protein